MPQAPPAGLIEAARDELKRGVSPQLLQTQFEELAVATGNSYARLAAGYELGLQVARVMIRQNTAVVLAGLKPEDIL
jgi:hypothetical protein